MRSSTCDETENFRLIVTPSTFTCSILQISGTAGGEMVCFRLLFGRSKTISKDLTRFSYKLFALDDASMCSTLAVHVLSLAQVDSVLL